MAKHHLTKSRFKLGLECPTKIYYYNHPEYASAKQDNPFLEALAKGGFQVEEYARVLYGPGKLITEKDPVTAFRETLKGIKNDETIFEGAFLHDNLYVRCDMLLPDGNAMDLIEIKAKSIDGDTPSQEVFLTDSGRIRSKWKPYLWDVAFQTYVAGLVLPDVIIRPSLLLADKSKSTDRDGLHEMFRIIENSTDLRDGIETPDGISAKDLDQGLLKKVDVSAYIEMILTGKELTDEGETFAAAVHAFSASIRKDLRLFNGVGKKCKGCEYRVNSVEKGQKNGFSECWAPLIGTDQIGKSMAFDMWNWRGADSAIANRIFLAENLPPFKEKISDGELDDNDRRQLQLKVVRGELKKPFAVKSKLRNYIDGFSFPLHFIDFETSTHPLPHFKGHRPYESVAFQFSHHILEENGKIDHAGEFLCTDPGVFPNFEFVRALKQSLGDVGTVFRYAHHENTILRKIREQLVLSDQTDREELISFIDLITQTKDHQGARNMVDLCEVIKKSVYWPETDGSNSIKDVLPASLKASEKLKRIFTRPLSENGVGSLNFPPDHIWMEGDEPSPYKALPTPFEGLDADTISNYFKNDQELSDGGAAATAYGKLQYQSLNANERAAMEDALKRYCELDTLAMVMVYLHLEELAKQ